MAMDSCNGSYAVHVAFESEIPYWIGDNNCEKGLERSLAMHGSRDHSWGQAEGVDRVSPL